MVSRWELLLCSGDLEAAPSASRCRQGRPPTWRLPPLGRPRTQPSSSGTGWGWCPPPYRPARERLELLRWRSHPSTAWTAVLSWCSGPGGGGQLLHLYRELRQLVVIHQLSEDEDVISSDDESRPNSGKKFSREAFGVGSLVHQEPRLGPDRLESSAFCWNHLI